MACESRKFCILSTKKLLLLLRTVCRIVKEAAEYLNVRKQNSHTSCRMNALDVRDLCVRFDTDKGPVDAVRGVSFSIEKGELLALVGESGSGKSATALSIPQLLPRNRASHPRGSIHVGGAEMIGASEATLRKVRGGKVGMIFQEPMTSLNPLQTIEYQIGETLRLHQGLPGRALRDRTLELLDLVGLDRAQERMASYPHQLSGGQRQRVMIAI